MFVPELHSFRFRELSHVLYHRSFLSHDFAQLKDMNDYVRAFSEIGPLLDTYDRELQSITDLYNQARDRDQRLLSVARLYGKPRLMN